MALIVLSMSDIDIINEHCIQFGSLLYFFSIYESDNNVNSNLMWKKYESYKVRNANVLKEN